MITVNGISFAQNDKEMIDSLFKPVNGRTCQGYAKRLKDKIVFFDLQRKEIATLVRNPHGVFLVNSHVVNGKRFYQYSLGEYNKPIFGLQNLGYMAENAAIEKMAEQAGI